MKKLKKVLVPFAAATIALTLTACSAGTSSTSSQTTTEKSEKVKITTNKGEVEVNKNPKSVAVFDIAVLDLIQRYNVKIDKLSSAKVNAKYVMDLVKDKETAGSLKEPNYEALSQAAPEVIFTNNRQEELLGELGKIGTTAHFLQDGKDFFNSMITFNTEVAKVFGVEDKVAADKVKFEAKIKEISEKAKASGKKVLILMTNEGKITAFGEGSRFGFIHSLFGFEAADKNIAVSQHGNEVNYEYISKVNPDIIFYVDRNSVVTSKTNSSAATTLDNELVKATTAGKNGAIYELEAQYAYLAANGLTAFEKNMEVIEKAAK